MVPMMATVKKLARILVVLAALVAPLLAASQAPASAGINAGEDVFNFGDAEFFGSTGKLALNAPLVGMAATPTGKGYWLLARDGGVFGFGDAVFHGSTGNLTLNQPVVGLASDPTNRGYWFVAADGGIFAFDVPFFGSMGSQRLNQPVVGMAASRTGDGYWLVARDGGIFAFGDAQFSGSTGAIRLNQPIVGMAADPDGKGYWFVAADGGVFAFDAPFLGSGVGRILAGDRVVGMAANAAGTGYWLFTARGGVYPFGTAESFGDATTSVRSVAAAAPTPSGKGYWLTANRPLTSPPGASLSAPADAIRATPGSSCWKSEPGAPALCADTFGFPSTASILNVRRGDTVTIRFDSPEGPLNGRVLVLAGNDTAATIDFAGANPTTFVADLPAGLHRMLVATNWVQGDMTHFFRLNVR